MYRTVVLSSHVTVQGIFVRDLPDGRMVVRVGERLYVGQPIDPQQKAA